ncbi:unnamed protein product [Adineta steineri]|uniref:Armadillo-like helical domain-containing protein n=1 Tax=Adineta steineri TaxID=433720 RepID=A0A814Q5L6_9BILA|nr:unnamed protein product [Adineta steineri]CAF1557394.1 unnamed protein product [Adineta steineri]CAF1558206.1 unnamed protein product [Adineta steineri]
MSADTNNSNKSFWPVKTALKEKIVVLYDALLTGDQPWLENGHYWDDFFLLKVNSKYLLEELERTYIEKPSILKPQLNIMFDQCLLFVNSTHRIRQLNAYYTICILIHVISRVNQRNGFGYPALDFLCGTEGAENKFETLIESVNHTFLIDESFSGSTLLKNTAFDVVLTCCTTMLNINENMLMDYMMANANLFDSIMQLVIRSPASHGYDICLLLALLLQYHKYDTSNTYIVRFSVFDDEVALTSLAQIIGSSLNEYNKAYDIERTANESSSWWSSLTTFVGSAIQSGTGNRRMKKVDDCLLLAFYEAVHLNRNFISALTHTATNSWNTKGLSLSNNDSLPPSLPAMSAPSGHVVQDQMDLSDMEDFSGSNNLLSIFLEYCSIIQQFSKNEDMCNTTKLCYLILLCITEDEFANATMHDENVIFSVYLHKAPMRHRKRNSEKNPPSRPLAVALLDLTMEFIWSHMMRNFPYDLYTKCIGIIQRILSFQKRTRTRLSYPWRPLWNALITLLKFLQNCESQLTKHRDLFQLASKIINIFNLFITFGDTFLRTPEAYDEVFYETVRCYHIFDNLFAFACRYANNDNEYKESALKLMVNLTNIKLITHHFNTKIEAFSNSQNNPLTENQVLDIIRNNYDTLALKLHDDLDQYDSYSEKATEASFFANTTRNIIGNYRRQYTLDTNSSVQLSNILLNEVPTIS